MRLPTQVPSPISPFSLCPDFLVYFSSASIRVEKLSLSGTSCRYGFISYMCVLQSGNTGFWARDWKGVCPRTWTRSLPPPPTSPLFPALFSGRKCWRWSVGDISRKQVSFWGFQRAVLGPFSPPLFPEYDSWLRMSPTGTLEVKKIAPPFLASDPFGHPWYYAYSSPYPGTWWRSLCTAGKPP